MALPPGLTQSQFDDALAEFADVVGAEWVFRQDEHLESYRDPFSPLRNTPAEALASAAVGPDSVEQVQQVLRIANDYGIPLWVISTGKNFGYGGPAGVVPGAVTLDMQRMNRIIEVNESQAYAVVEPGVSYFDLYRHIQERGLKLWIDNPEPGWGSVVGNTLERGTGYTPYGDHVETQCGLEVVLPNGELLRTGMGAVPNSETWHEYKWGFGPYVEGLFSQSNLGVVTRMGVWLMDEPPAYRAGQMTVARHEEIVELIDILKPLWRQRILTNYPNMRRVDFAGPSGWFNRLAFYGDRQVVERHWELVQDAYASLPGAELETTLYEAPYNPAEWDLNTKLLAGVPYMNAMYGIGHNVYFALVVPFRGAAIWDVIQTLDGIAQRYGRRFYGTPVHVHSPRGLLTTVSIRVDKNDPELNAQTIEMGREMVAESARRGWGVYRVAPAFSDIAAAAYGYNDNALMRFNEALKDLIDPNGILQPGKNGIWPANMREDRG